MSVAFLQCQGLQWESYSLKCGPPQSGLFGSPHHSPMALYLVSSIQDPFLFGNMLFYFLYFGQFYFKNSESSLEMSVSFAIVLVNVLETTKYCTHRLLYLDLM